MLLKDVLQHIDFMQKIQILEFSAGLHDYDEEILFEGYSDDVPWRIAEMELDTDTNGGALSTFIKDDDQEAWFMIYVREVE